jgi:glutathione S-transferase
MTPPVLWSWNLSPFAGKVRIAFAEKGVPVELIEIHPVRRPARLGELNPNNRVPVLELADGGAIWESSAICDWLEETHPEPPLYPRDPAQRGLARALTRWVDDELTRNFFLAARKEAFGLDPTDHPDLVVNLRATLVKRLRAAERLLAKHDGPWLLDGPDPTLADLSALPLAVRLPEWRPELVPDAHEHPRLAAWFERLRARPSAAEVDRRGTPAPEPAGR